MTARVSFDFTGTTALITGGTSGIGHATASLFRDAGAQVTITGTKPSATDYEVDLSGMAYHQLQFTDNDSVDALAHDFTQLDVLVNNAGANFPGGLDESKPDGFEASVALNLTGPYRLTVGLYRALRASTTAGGASVVNLASMSALRAVPLVPGYGAAKAGIVNITRNLAVKWAGQGNSGECRGARGDRHPDDRTHACRCGTGGFRAGSHPAAALRIRQRDCADGGISVHRAEQLHEWSGLRRRRRVGLRLKSQRKKMTFALRPEDYYHTGIVVPDLDAAMARLSAVAGYEWINPLTYTLPFRTVNGTRELTSTFVYSLQSPHVELIQQVPDSPWTAAPGNSVHHLGYFTDDLAETARKLEANGFTFEATADTAPPDLALFAYYIDAFGTRIEIVDRALFPDFPAFLQAAAAPTKA
jgi:3-oxoacyl-[acyl-carrier protein] reductase